MGKIISHKPREGIIEINLPAAESYLNATQSMTVTLQISVNLLKIALVMRLKSIKIRSNKFEHQSKRCKLELNFL